MTKIPCQCGKPENGCSRCGGSGVVLEQTNCKACGKSYWVRPGVYSSFEGKRWQSLDGLQLVDTAKHGTLCLACWEKKNE